MLRTIASRSAVLCRVGRRHLALPPYTELPMPALSPTMTSGNLASWKKAEGEEIAVGDVIAEVETDKVRRAPYTLSIASAPERASTRAV